MWPEQIQVHCKKDNWLTLVIKPACTEQNMCIQNRTEQIFIENAMPKGL